MPVFLLTDIEGSTEKWEKYKDAMKQALERHDTILKENIEGCGGAVIKHTGDGILAVFEDGDPLKAVLEIQLQFAQEDWGAIGTLRIRVGLHAGYAEKRGEDYFGPVINRTARVMSAAWGGQVLLTPEVSNSCKLPANTTLNDLGTHLLKDLGEPQQLYGLVHPKLKQDFPPPRSLSARPHNLAPQPTPFLDRVDTLGEVVKLIDDPSCRLLTLVGPGGIGKTRIGLQVAADLIEKFRNGVYYVPLASLTSGSTQFLVFTIADCINFSFYSKEDPKVQLLNYLREKEMLLILDNFEHLLEEAGLLSEILKETSKVKLLVVSRERLNLKGEWTYEVKGMEFPKAKKIDTVEDYGAVQLFIQGAKQVDPNFSLKEEDTAHVVRICQLVGGLPLGIELASAWARTLSLDEILNEIEKNLDFLESSMRDVPERHRSLRAVFDYSWNLLSQKEQEVFMKIAIFQDTFTREAVQEVTEISLPLLNSLMDKSLLRRTPDGRYELLAILKQYAREKLKEFTDIKDEISYKFAQYYGDFLLKRDKRFITGDKETIQTLRTEIENILAAWNWTVEHKEEGLIEKFVYGLNYFYLRSGLAAEGVKEFEKALKTIQTKKDSIVYYKLLTVLAGFQYSLGNYDKARENAQKSLASFEKEGSQKEIALAMMTLGNIAYVEGRYQEAKNFYQKCAETFRRLDEPFRVSSALNNLAVVITSLGNYEEAMKLHRKMLSINEKINSRSGIATAYNNMGILNQYLGNYDKAKELQQKSLEIQRELDDQPGVAVSLSNLALVHKLQGDYDEARKKILESLSIRENCGDQWGIVISLDNLGNVALCSGNLEEAKDYFQRSMKIAQDLGLIPLLLEIINGVAELRSKQGEILRALELLYLVRDHPKTDGESKRRAERLLSEIGSTVSSEEKEKAQKTAEKMVFEELVVNILKE